MRPDLAMRFAFTGLIGEATETGELPAAGSIENLLAIYGSTAGIAEAAGFGTAAEARAQGPAAVRARENFMRDLRRYRQGTRRPSPEMRALFNLEPSPGERPRTLRRVVELIESMGVTFTGAATVHISEDEVEREWPPPGWWVSPGVWASYEGLSAAVRGRHWDEVADLFSGAMGDAYGVHFSLADVDWLTLKIGRVPGAQALTV